MLIIAIILSCAYCFVAGQFYEYDSRLNPELPVLKTLLLSLAWPGNVILFLVMRCWK